MRDLFIVLGFSLTMAVITLALIPAAVHRSMPKNAPATVLFGPGNIADHGETAYDMTPAAGSSGGAFAMAGVGGSKAGSDGKADVSEKVAG